MDKRNRASPRSPSVEKRKKSENPIAIARPGARRGADLVTAVRELGGFGPPDDRIDPTSIEIGERIRSSRMLLGWTQSYLAKRAKCSQSDISAIERGRFGPQGPSLRTLVALANALKIDLCISPLDGPQSGIDIKTVGDVRHANANLCTAHAIFTQTEWQNVRDYVRRQHLEFPTVDHVAPYCTLYTLGADAEVKNISAEIPMIATIVHGRCEFVFYSGPNRRVHHAGQRGVSTLIQGGERFDFSASGTDILTMMMVPVQNLGGLDDDEHVQSC